MENKTTFSVTEYLTPEERKQYDAAISRIEELEKLIRESKAIISSLRDGVGLMNIEMHKRHMAFMIKRNNQPEGELRNT